MTQKQKQSSHRKQNKLLVIFIIVIIMAMVLSTMGTAIIYIFPQKEEESNVPTPSQDIENNESTSLSGTEISTGNNSLTGNKSFTGTQGD